MKEIASQLTPVYRQRIREIKASGSVDIDPDDLDFDEDKQVDPNPLPPSYNPPRRARLLNSIQGQEDADAFVYDAEPIQPGVVESAGSARGVNTPTAPEATSSMSAAQQPEPPTFPMSTLSSPRYL